MSLLKKLASKIRESETRPADSPMPAAIAAEELPARQQGESSGPSYVMLPRRVKLPISVIALPWGGPLPSYVEHTDGVYLQEGGERSPTYYLVGTRPTPPWHNPQLRIKSDPTPNNCPHCCYDCGRRLFYKTIDGAEHCFTCRPIVSAKSVPDQFVDDEESGDTVDNVTFFLKKGLGYDW